MKALSSLTLSLFLVTLFAGSGWANTKQIKVYKEAFPNAEKPKCIACHTVEKPKKEGNHELNDYGKKVVALAETPTVEDYKKVGKIEA